MALALIVYGVGRLALLPAMFDTSGMGIFATDGYVYRLEAISLARILTREGIMAWLATPSPFHVKLYSLSFAAFGPVLGFNVLSAEPLNILYYLAILTLVFMLGREVFDRRTGLLAAAIVALWPSLLLHTTQLLRDPLFVVSMLALVLIYARWLKDTYAWRKGLLTGALGGMVVAVLWSNRSNVWDLVVAIVFLGAVLIVVGQLCQRRARVGNLLGLSVLLLLTLTVPRVLPESPSHMEQAVVVNLAADQDLSVLEGQPVVTSSAGEETTTTPSLWDRLWTRIKEGRARFKTEYPDAGSNIDTEVQFNSLGDVVGYIPRAVVIGFFAPFPQMWFKAGDLVGVQGRLLSGMETLLMYAVEALALVGLWRSRRRLSVWLLVLVAAMGLTAFGLVVLNVATLYRMRYTFWMLLIIVGAHGALRLSFGGWHRVFRHAKVPTHLKGLE
ncbi:MAG: hypothetical protein WCF57_12045 [Pyrinomonadaceae bacterium]